MTDEIWKPVILDNVDTGWKVSNMGNFIDSYGRIKNPTKTGSGYFRFKIKDKNLYAHVIVCKLFHGEPPTLEHTQVHHKNSIRTDNSASNLEWTTPSENFKETFKNPYRKTSGKKLSKKIEYRKIHDKGPWNICESLNHASNTLNIDISSISMVINNKRISAGGYFFRKVEDCDLEGEIWVDFFHKGKRYENMKISNKMRYKNLQGMKIKPSPRYDGYVEIKVNGLVMRFHDIVCESFNGKRQSDNYLVDHIDMNPSNNTPENLEWVTPEENIQRSYLNNKNRKRPGTGFKIQVRRKNTEIWTTYNSLNDAAKDIGVSNGMVSMALNKKRNMLNYEIKYY